jgi:histidyl-tRNA synthetase
VLGGGRYDGLIENLGGPHTPAVGWAAGIERLAMLVDGASNQSPDVAMILANPEKLSILTEVTSRLRRRGYAVETTFKGNFKKQLQRANASNAKYAIIVGLDECYADDVVLKNLESGTQAHIKIASVADDIADPSILKIVA